MNILAGKSASKIRQFKIDLTLTPAQQEIEANSKRFTFLRAGRKFGKTKYSEYKALKWLSRPNAVHWHIAPTYKQARLISWDAYKRLIPQEAMYKKPNDSDLIIHLKNNAQLYLMGSDEPDSLRGPAPTSTTLEEAAYHKAGVWSDIIRPNLTVHRAPALFISSPNGFNWFKDQEDQALLEIEEKGDAAEWAVFHRTIYDNPYISRDEIESIKRTCDPRAWNQEYMAEYESSVGRVFYEFQDTSRHVYNFPLPNRSESCGRSVDWGLRDDCGILWSFIRNNKLHIYRENADHGIPASAQARLMKNRSPQHETVSRNIIGHDANRTDSEMQGLTVKWHFTNEGISPLRLSSRKKSGDTGSRAHLQELISSDRLVIHPECRKLRKQLLSYSWKDTAMEKTEDGNDDLIDSLHYTVEMWQYDLFLSPRVSDEKTYAEKHKEFQVEKEALKIRRYSLVPDERSSMFEVQDTHAGYL